MNNNNIILSISNIKSLKGIAELFVDNSCNEDSILANYIYKKYNKKLSEADMDRKFESALSNMQKYKYIILKQRQRDYGLK